MRRVDDRRPEDRRLDDRRPEDRRPEERGETRAVVHRAEAAQQQHARTLDSEAIKQYRSIQQNTAQPGAGGGQQRWVVSYTCQLLTIIMIMLRCQYG